jgi:hypothetical protein
VPAKEASEQRKEKVVASTTVGVVRKTAPGERRVAPASDAAAGATITTAGNAHERPDGKQGLAALLTIMKTLVT